MNKKDPSAWTESYKFTRRYLDRLKAEEPERYAARVEDGRARCAASYAEIKSNPDAYKKMLDDKRWYYICNELKKQGMDPVEFFTPHGVVAWVMGWIVLNKICFEKKRMLKLKQKIAIEDWSRRNRPKKGRPPKKTKEEKLEVAKARLARNRDHHINWVLCNQPQPDEAHRAEAKRFQRALWWKRYALDHPEVSKKARLKISEMQPDVAVAVRAKRASYTREKRASDVNFKIGGNIRRRLCEAVHAQGAKKHERTRTLIGCSIPELRAHLERQFKPGMSWENYGYNGWHIDHIIPLASFDLTSAEARKKAAHFTNLQPLWREENQKKSDSVNQDWPCQLAAVAED